MAALWQKTKASPFQVYSQKIWGHVFYARVVIIDHFGSDRTMQYQDTGDSQQTSLLDIETEIFVGIMKTYIDAFC